MFAALAHKKSFLQRLKQSQTSCFYYSTNYFGNHKNILHCGAHLGEEFPIYRESGAQQIYWLEANPNLISILIDKFGAEYVFQYALTSESNTSIPFFLTENVLSSSTKKIKVENEWGVSLSEKIEVQTISLSDLLEIVPIKVDLLVLDLQGGELDALSGPTLKRYPKFLIVEVTDLPFYEEGASFMEVGEKLRVLGYQRLKVVKGGTHGHGEALFIFRPKFRELVTQVMARSIGALFSMVKSVKKQFSIPAVQ